MPPKKSETKAEAAASKPKAGSAHGTYQDMIYDAIIALKDRNGSSRQSIKKYVKANNTINVPSEKMFDSLFNKALKTGVEKGIFEQPKGPSGGTKLAKKGAKPVAPKKAAVPKKEVAKKEVKEVKEPKEKKAAPKKAAPKKEAAKKEPKEKKAAAPKEKKAAAPKKAAAKKDTPAVVDKPTVLTKTKSGRVAKTAKPAAPKKAAPKKAAPKAKKAKADKPAEAAA